MRFRFFDQAKQEFLAARLCHVMGVCQSGYFAWKGRPDTHRQRSVEKLLQVHHARIEGI